MKAKELIRLKKLEAQNQYSFELKKKLNITQINKDLCNENNVSTPWYQGLLIKGTKRSNV
jgi:hypothetical protein